MGIRVGKRERMDADEWDDILRSAITTLITLDGRDRSTLSEAAKTLVSFFERRGKQFDVAVDYTGARNQTLCVFVAKSRWSEVSYQSNQA